MKDKIKEIVDNHLVTVRDQLRTSDNHIHDTLDTASEKLIEALGDLFETDVVVDLEPIIKPGFASDE